jgi:hypothetical protein
MLLGGLSVGSLIIWLTFAPVLRRAGNHLPAVAEPAEVT